MASYQQKRVEYEVREYSGGSGSYGAAGGFGGASYDTPAGGTLSNVSGYSYGGAAGGGSYGGGSYGAAGGYGGGSYGGGASYGGGYAGAGTDAYGSVGGQSQVYKAEMQTMPAKSGVYGHSSGMFESSGGHQMGPMGGAGGGDPFCALVPSSFPPGTDPKFIDCFNRIDKDRSGLICDQELQSALSNFDQRFCLRTVHLLMYLFTGSNAKVVGPREFVPLVRSLQTWKATFQKHDSDRNGRLDERELRCALMSMGYEVSPFVLKLLMSKFDKSGYKCAIEYDYFIECCVVVKGLSDKFRVKAESNCGTASFTYDEFLLNVLPFIVA